MSAQKLEGVYKFKYSYSRYDTSLYLFKNGHYRHLYTINYWNGRDTHIRKVAEGRYKAHKDGFSISDDGPLGGEEEYTLAQATDSGFQYEWVENIKIFVSKTSMSEAVFDSVFRAFEKIPQRKFSPITSNPITSNQTRGLILQNTATQKNRIVPQSWLMDIYRVYIDSAFHYRDTFLQVLHGYIDSVGDSLMYVKAYAFNINNHRTMEGWYDFDSDKPLIQTEWTMMILDSIFCFPKSQLTSIKRYKKGSEIGDVLIGASLANAVASPFYSINYKDYKVNKSLFNTSLITSAGVFLTGFIMDILARPDYYSFCKRCPGHWILAGLK